MEQLGIIEVLIRTGTFVLAIGVFIATWFTRTIVETAFPKLKKKADENDLATTYVTQFSRWWNSVILYSIPVTYGALLGLGQIDYIFGPMKDSRLVCVMFGGGVGWFSSFMYKIVRKSLAKRFGVNIESIPPGA